MPHSDSLDHLSNDEVVKNLDALRAKELQGEHDIVRHIEQIDRRGIYRDLGYSSLFAYCTKRLEYTPPGAQRRIDAARCLRKHPEVYDHLKSKELTLTAVSTISKVVVTQNKPELITQALGKPIHEVERLVAEYRPVESPKRDTVRVRRVAVNESVETRVSITIELDTELMGFYEKAGRFMGVKGPREVVGRLLRDYVKRMEKPVRKAPVRAKPRSTSSRYISRSVKAKVFQRDGYQCSFVSEDGRRCEECHRLQFDHIVPWSNGGSSEASNLRLLCRAHNQLHAERCFGREFVLRHFRSGSDSVRAG